MIHAAFLVTNRFSCVGKIFMDSLGPAVKVLAAQTGLFGGHMIEIGRRGLTPAPFSNFLEALSLGVKEPRIIKNMVEIGSATGFDLAIGMTVTVKEWLGYSLVLDK